MALNRQHIEEVVASLRYDFTQFDPTGFVRHVAWLRRRAMQVMAGKFSPGLSGALVHTPTVDFIFYLADAHPVHVNHIVLHEMGHILLAHPLRKANDLLSDDLLQHIDPDSRVHLAGPNRVHDGYEEEAEYFVYTVQREIRAAERLAALTGIPSVSPITAGSLYGFAGKVDRG